MDLALQHPEKVTSMFASLRKHQSSALFAQFDEEAEKTLFGANMSFLCRHNASRFLPKRGKSDPRACTVALERYNGTWGPWL